MKLIPLSQGKFAMVDDNMFDELNQWKWSYGKGGYAFRSDYSTGKHKQILMHRFILGLVDPKTQVDHEDQNGLNNQKYNLRKCNHSQNGSNKGLISTNKSGFKGVSWVKASNKWVASIRVNNKTINLGVFEDKIEAAKVYNEAAKENFGEFAWLNQIPS